MIIEKGELVFMENKEKISIIIPTYNRCQYLKQLIQSIFNQSYNNIELIVINDNSTDDTDIYMKEVKKENSKITYIKNKKNKGPSYNRLIGYERAKGTYIIFADDDDYYTDNNFFEKAVRVFEKKEFKDIALVSGNVKRLDQGKKIFLDADIGISGHINGIEYLSQLQLKYQKPYSTFTTLFKRDALENAKFNDLEMVNDAPIYMRALMAGDIYIMKDVIGVYREHSQNISKSLPTDFLIANIEEKRKIYKILDSKDKRGKWCDWYIEQMLGTIRYFLFFNKVPKQEFDRLYVWCIWSLDKKRWKFKLKMYKYRKQIKTMNGEK